MTNKSLSRVSPIVYAFVNNSIKSGWLTVASPSTFNLIASIESHTCPILSKKKNLEQKKKISSETFLFAVSKCVANETEAMFIGPF